MNPRFSETAAGRIADDIRRAEAHRRGNDTRKVRASASTSRGRALGHAVVAVLLWPTRH
jgi:hypothetical protein